MTRDEAIYSAGYIEGACLLLWTMVDDDKISAEAVSDLEEKARGIAEHLMGKSDTEGS